MTWSFEGSDKAFKSANLFGSPLEVRAGNELLHTINQHTAITHGATMCPI